MKKYYNKLCNFYLKTHTHIHSHTHNTHTTISNLWRDLWELLQLYYDILMCKLLHNVPEILHKKWLNTLYVVLYKNADRERERDRHTRSHTQTHACTHTVTCTLTQKCWYDMKIWTQVLVAKGNNSTTCVNRPALQKTLFIEHITCPTCVNNSQAPCWPHYLHNHCIHSQDIYFIHIVTPTTPTLKWILKQKATHRLHFIVGSLNSLCVGHQLNHNKENRTLYITICVAKQYWR